MLILNGTRIEFKSFPNGEVYADVPSRVVLEKGNVFHLRFESDADLLHLMWLKDTVDARVGKVPSLLFCPYFPYSRMDRAEQDRMFTLKSVAGMINAMGFDSVWSLEPHSDVLPALVNNFHALYLLWDGFVTGLPLLAAADWLVDSGVIEPGYEREYQSFQRLRKKAEGPIDYSAFYNAGVYFVYPDAGAQKRYGKEYAYSNVIPCAKDRDFESGKIRGIIPVLTDEAINNCRCAIIVDDLCSGGRTFIEVSKALHAKVPNLERVVLCVPHCENTVVRNLFDVHKNVDKVYTTNSIFLSDAGVTEDEKASLQLAVNSGEFVVFNLHTPAGVKNFLGGVSIGG